MLNERHRVKTGIMKHTATTSPRRERDVASIDRSSNIDMEAGNRRKMSQIVKKLRWTLDFICKNLSRKGTICLDR